VIVGVIKKLLFPEKAAFFMTSQMQKVRIRFLGMLLPLIIFVQTRISISQKLKNRPYDKY